MTDNPYETPKAKLTKEDRLAATGDFTIGEALQQGWDTTWATIGVWLPAGILGVVIAGLAAITIIGYFVVVPVIGYGFILLLLNMNDRKADIGDIFAGFSKYGTALGRMLLLSLLFLCLSLLCNSLAYVGMAIESPGLTGVGQIVGTVANIMIAVRLYFAFFVVVDQDMPAVESLKASWEITRGKGLSLLLMVLLCVVIIMAGMVAFLVGVIPATVICYAMFASAYRQICPLPSSATALSAD